jgi:hypothetical protein
VDGLELHSSDDGASFSTQTRLDRLPLTAVAANRQGQAVLYSRLGPVKNSATPAP